MAAEIDKVIHASLDGDDLHNSKVKDWLGAPNGEGGSELLESPIAFYLVWDKINSILWISTAAGPGDTPNIWKPITSNWKVDLFIAEAGGQDVFILNKTPILDSEDVTASGQIQYKNVTIDNAEIELDYYIEDKNVNFNYVVPEGEIVRIKYQYRG